MEKFGHVVFEDNCTEGREHYLYKFDNNYGASVVKHYFSYGNERGLYELAVIVWDEAGLNFALVYDTEITDDVIGNLNPSGVERLLNDIKNLKQEV